VARAPGAACAVGVVDRLAIADPFAAPAPLDASQPGAAMPGCQFALFAAPSAGQSPVLGRGGAQWCVDDRAAEP